MANIFDTLESALQGNGLSGALTGVVGSLTGVSSLISGSGANPPKSIADFGPALRSLALPNLDVSSVFGSSFDALKSALPSDLSSVTGGLTSGIDQLKTSGSGLTEQLGESLKVVQALYQLTQLDFTGTGAAGGAPPAAGGGAGAGAGAGTPPAQPAQPPVSAQSMDQVRGALDGLPSPFTVDSFLTWLEKVLADVRLDDFGLRQFLIIGELRDYLATLLNWKNSSPDAIRAQLADTLAHLDTYLKNPLDAVLGRLSGGASGLAGKLHATELAQVADGILARLGELKAPVASGSLSGAGASITALTALLDQYDQLKITVQTDLAALPAFQRQLQDLPDDLDDQMGRVVSSLRPSNSLGILDDVAAGAQSGAAAIQKPIDDLRRFLGRIVAWLEDLLNKIDFKAVTQPIEDAAKAMKSAVDALDNTMVAVTMQVQQIFGKVEAVLDLLDPDKAAAQAKTAIDGFKARIAQKIGDLLKPVLDAVAKVVDTIAKGVQAFDPNQLKAALHDAIQKIAGVLADPRVAEVRKDLDNVAQQLEAFSFAPFTGEVTKGLQAIADTLKSLGDLPAPLGEALDAALSVLPSDLKPITDPIVDEFGQIVNAGPVKVLDEVADLPKQLADKVRSFDPNSLVGSSLSEPYNKLLSDMQGFKPSSLLDPVKQELDSLKDRLKENVNPANALEGLEAPFQEISKALDNFHPDEIIAPLDEKLKGVLSGITATIPLDNVFGQVQAAIQKVKDAIDTATSATAMLDKARGILHGLADPQTQLDAWLAPILAKLDNLGDTSAMQASLASVSASVDGLTAAAVTAKVNAAVDPVASALATLDPQTRWTAVVQAVRALPAAAVDALPASAQKTQLKAALARLDPSQPATGAPFQTLAGVAQAIAAAKSALQAALSGWDAQYTAAGSALGGLRGLDPTAAHLKQWIHDAVTEELIHPLAGIFSLAAPAFSILDAVVGELQALLNSIESKVADLLAGVAALNGIRDSLQEVLDRVKNFNLGFLRDSLKDLFDKLRAKLDAVNPANLGKALDALFQEVLDSLGVDLFLPPADVAKIDADYAKLIDTLKSLDPANVVANVVQDEFEKDVLPLLDQIDMSDPLHRIAERLSSLTEELKTELGKVEDAFDGMKNAIPAGAAA
jgi:hypothetical protein